jgi:hypothetical protein
MESAAGGGKGLLPDGFAGLVAIVATVGARAHSAA